MTGPDRMASAEDYGECQACNEPGERPYPLVLDDRDETQRMNLILCELCAVELAATEWITVDGVEPD